MSKIKTFKLFENNNEINEIKNIIKDGLVNLDDYGLVYDIDLHEYCGSIGLQITIQNPKNIRINNIQIIHINDLNNFLNSIKYFDLYDIKDDILTLVGYLEDFYKNIDRCSFEQINIESNEFSKSSFSLEVRTVNHTMPKYELYTIQKETNVFRYTIEIFIEN